MGYLKKRERHAQESMMKKRSWTHEGPSIQKRDGHMKVQEFKKKGGRER